MAVRLLLLTLYLMQMGTVIAKPAATAGNSSMVGECLAQPAYAARLRAPYL